MIRAAVSIASRVVRRSDDGGAPSRRTTAAAAVLLSALVVVGFPTAAHAHAEFDSSSPTSGEVVVEPVEEVVITFSAAAEPIGEEFVALDGDGTRRSPVEVDVVDDRVFTLRFDPPLGGGRIGIRWEIAATDSHSKSGAFTFEVTGAAPTVAGEFDESIDPGEVADADTAAAVPSNDTDAAVGSEQTLDEFLSTSPSRPGETTALIGRMITLPAVVLAIGALAFAAVAFRGSAGDLRFVLGLARLSGLVLVVGGVLDYLGVVRLLDLSVFGGVGRGTAAAALLRAVGGAVLVVGISRVLATGAIERPRALSSAVIDANPAGALRTHGASGTSRSGSARWRIDGRSALIGVALGAIVSSFWLDGHTASKGNRFLHSFVDSVHVVAGGVWAGGVATMAALFWIRRRRGRPAALATTFVRFSGLATLSLAAVVGAGVIMAVIVLDSPGDLTSTEWGQILLLKTSAVAIIAALGGLNHVVLVPAIERDPHDPQVLERIRTTLAVEAILLTFVVLVTAWLVAAAS